MRFLSMLFIAVLFSLLSSTVHANTFQKKAWDIYFQAQLDSEISFYTFAKGYLEYLKHGRKPILSIIDYTLPSSFPRMWIIDLAEKKLVKRTYVSHGTNSGTLFATQFSNTINSKQTSLGTYRGAEVYYGKHGRSLRLDGLSEGNSNARKRAIVIHGADYANPDVITKIGMLGRSWGCPAVPSEDTNVVVDYLKDGATIYTLSNLDNPYLLAKK
ncbi:murein L,D-transpeptidase catalytic domain family protein [Photobacterium toruni]|uniref:L,D-transpeptidase catalytic domain n=1 Tax=Photobacterium toruni TaxID=1935446 RepID=A0A1T4UST8_9GAMM|nr:murein L,D-transpeptidase catalytic domain family protein [Photobacterium toruni]SKA55733.1 hypothetical protein CZ814_03657 [Photobacterium toruni]